MKMKILIKYPSRGRPRRFFEGLRSIYEQAAHYDNFHIIATLDEDDTTMNNPRIIEEIGLYPNLTIAWGHSDSKVHAINRDVPMTPWDILLVFSDDMRFQVFGWDLLVIDAFSNRLDRFIHFYEPNSGDRVSVMHIVGRRYYERDDFVYDPRYKSLFCDEAATEIARIRGCYHFHQTQIFYHDNPAVTGVGIQDEMLKEQQRIGWNIDQDTFLKHKELNFEQ